MIITYILSAIGTRLIRRFAYEKENRKWYDYLGSAAMTILTLFLLEAFDFKYRL